MSQKDNAKYVITSSTELKPWVRPRDIILTCLIWFAYFYFMEDFFVFVWHVIQWSNDGFHDGPLRPDFAIVNTIFSYLETIFFMGSVYIGWAIYNLLRFRGKTRRQTPSPVTPQDLAALYNFSADDIALWQTQTNMTMFHDGVGYLLQVRDNSATASET